MPLPLITDLIADAQKLHDSVDALNAAGGFKTASKWLTDARGQISAALGNLNSHAAVNPAPAAVAVAPPVIPLGVVANVPAAEVRAAAAPIPVVAPAPAPALTPAPVEAKPETPAVVKLGP